MAFDGFDRRSEQRDQLRFLTCGSVDDGKSTLIGRLLYDSGSLADDQLAALERDSARHGTAGDELDFALLVDGLEAERQQGITIDVAYRYFSTARRSFIVADTPGHEQYTRNMATGASTSDLAVLLVDARKGLLPQTKRHSAIVSLLGVRHVILAVNKMDLVGWDRATFEAIAAEYQGLSDRLRLLSVLAVPLSARSGSNLTRRGAETPWYDGPTLLERLESIDVARSRTEAPFRFPVQWVNRPDQSFRGFAGAVASGTLKQGDPVVVAGSGRESRIARIVTADGDLAEAEAGQAVTLTLTDEVDLARGDVLSPPLARPETTDRFSADLIWLDDRPLDVGRTWWIKIGARTAPVQVEAVEHRTDVNTLQPEQAETLKGGDVGLCRLRTAAPVAVDPFEDHPVTGAFILIDRETNATAAAGMIRKSLRKATDVHRQATVVNRQARESLNGHRAVAVWFTGLSGSGKSTVADLVEQNLHAQGVRTVLLDGDNLRHGLNADLGFSEADRSENVRRAGEVAKLFVEAGVVVLCSFISPSQEERDRVRERFADEDFVEVFVDASLDACIERDPKGLYARALRGEIPGFTGVSAPYERPRDPTLILNTVELSPAEAAGRVVGLIEQRIRRRPKA